MEKRTRRVEIRLSEAEYLKLLDLKTKPRLAEWVRETLLSNGGGVERVGVKKLDGRFLYELNRIGNNLNQLSKFCHREKKDFNVLRVLDELIVIEEQLGELLDNVEQAI